MRSRSRSFCLKNIKIDHYLKVISSFNLDEMDLRICYSISTWPTLKRVGTRFWSFRVRSCDWSCQRSSDSEVVKKLDIQNSVFSDNFDASDFGFLYKVISRSWLPLDQSSVRMSGQRWSELWYSNSVLEHWNLTLKKIQFLEPISSSFVAKDSPFLYLLSSLAALQGDRARFWIVCHLEGLVTLTLWKEIDIHKSVSKNSCFSNFSNYSITTTASY